MGFIYIALVVRVHYHSHGGRFYAPSFVGTLPSTCIVTVSVGIALRVLLYSVGRSGFPPSLPFIKRLFGGGSGSMYIVKVFGVAKKRSPSNFGNRFSLESSIILLFFDFERNLNHFHHHPQQYSLIDARMKTEK